MEKTLAFIWLLGTTGSSWNTCNFSIDMVTSIWVPSIATFWRKGRGEHQDIICHYLL